MTAKSHATRLAPQKPKKSPAPIRRFKLTSQALSVLAIGTTVSGLIGLSYQAVSSETLSKTLPSLAQASTLLPDLAPVHSPAINYEFTDGENTVVIATKPAIPVPAQTPEPASTADADEQGAFSEQTSDQNTPIGEDEYQQADANESDSLDVGPLASVSPGQLVEIKASNKSSNTTRRGSPLPKNTQRVIVKPGDTFSTIAFKYDLNSRDVHNIIANQKAKKVLNNLKHGSELLFETKGGNGKNFVSLTFRLSAGSQLKVTREKDGFEFSEIKDKLERKVKSVSGKVNSSLYVDAIEAGLPDRLVMSLIEIFQWEIDFSNEVRKGDRFKMAYEAYYRDGTFLRYGNILAAEYSNQGKTYKGYYYKPKQGQAGYYNEKGQNLSKAFLRNPVDVVRITSRFSLKRKHPVLHKIRAHKGVDYGAKRGTPIKATSRGVVKFIGKKGGYGRTVILQHGSKYTTLYAHMHKYRKGLKKGSKVRRGEVIGYVGSSGLATGPHLHYEFRVNDRHVDPLKVTAIRGDSLNKKDRNLFTAQIKPLQRKLAKLKAGSEDIKVAKTP